MKEKNDDVEQMIADQLQEEAEEIQKELEQEAQGAPPTTLSADIKVRMKLHVDQEIKQYEESKVYAQLSKEDREALEIGRELLKKKEEPTVIRKKRTWRLYVSIAAVFIMVMAVGVTSIGGPERIVEMLTKTIGDREVTKVNSGQDSALSAHEKEEEAYQRVKDELGIEPVRVSMRPEGVRFDRLESDRLQQMAEVIYTYEGYSMSLYMSTLYSDSSWGVDIEEEESLSWDETVQGSVVHMKEYVEAKTKVKRYSAEFEYMGVQYFINATMEREKFDYIIKKLYFFGK